MFPNEYQIVWSPMTNIGPLEAYMVYFGWGTKIKREKDGFEEFWMAVISQRGLWQPTPVIRLFFGALSCHGAWWLQRAELGIHFKKETTSVITTICLTQLQTSIMVGIRPAFRVIADFEYFSWWKWCVRKNHASQSSGQGSDIFLCNLVS